MADMTMTPALPGLTPQQWDDQFFREYIRENRFRKYMGTTEGAMIQVREDLTRKPGDSVTFGAMRKLVGAGVSGTAVLEGNEEVLDLRSMKVVVDVIRHAVAVTDWDEQRSAIHLRDACRPALKDWAMERLRTDVIGALLSIDGVAFAAASAGARNVWLADNQDRVLFGSARANNAGNVMSTSLANVDEVGDTLSAGVVSLAKRMARTAHPAIRPIRVADDQEWFVLFAHSFAFRDFKNDPAIRAANQSAGERGKNNPLFTDGDLMWDGVIVREVPEFPTVVGAGASGVDVAPCVLCGAQAVGVAYAQRFKTTENTRDYGFRHGVGVQEIRGVQKLRFGRNTGADTQYPVDQGVVTLFVSGKADA